MDCDPFMSASVMAGELGKDFTEVDLSLAVLPEYKDKLSCDVDDIVDRMLSGTRYCCYGRPLIQKDQRWNSKGYVTVHVDRAEGHLRYTTEEVWTRDKVSGNDIP